MRVRKQTSSGDYRMGCGQNDFFINSPWAVGQLVQTRLQLFQGAFFLDTSDGTPYFQQIMGASDSAQSLQNITNILQQRILQTPGVSQILDISPVFSKQTREYSLTVTILTIYSADPLQLLINSQGVTIVPPVVTLAGSLDFSADNSGLLPLL